MLFILDCSSIFYILVPILYFFTFLSLFRIIFLNLSSKPSIEFLIFDFLCLLSASFFLFSKYFFKNYITLLFSYLFYSVEFITLWKFLLLPVVFLFHSSSFLCIFVCLFHSLSHIKCFLPRSASWAGHFVPRGILHRLSDQ